jgi:hypothetical protein
MRQRQSPGGTGRSGHGPAGFAEMSFYAAHAGYACRQVERGVGGGQGCRFSLPLILQFTSLEYVDSLWPVAQRARAWQVEKHLEPSADDADLVHSLHLGGLRYVRRRYAAPNQDLLDAVSRLG